jgi:hypothetical protein
LGQKTCIRKDDHKSLRLQNSVKSLNQISQSNKSQEEVGKTQSTQHTETFFEKQFGAQIT